MPITRDAHYWDHLRDERKHEPRPGEPDFPIRLEPAPIKGSLEIAILAQAVPLTQAAELIERYVRAECAPPSSTKPARRRQGLGAAP
jgi:hypothetical protein